MGVRGKIEAVIYAAEEPVSLAQLVALFGEEALSEQPDEAEEGHAEQLELPDGVDTSEPAEDPAENIPEAEVLAEGQPQDALSEPLVLDGEPTLVGDPDADKRAAKLRDRRAREAVRATVEALIAEYSAGERGMEVREIAGGYRVATKPEYHDAVRAFAKSLKPPMKLSLPALETLAVIAYKQPVTAPEVSEIRGVDSGGVMGSLISRKLVTTAGRKQVVGRPILYKTTKEFLLRFGLKDLAKLPSMEEFEKMASELEALGEDPGDSPLASSAELLPQGDPSTEGEPAADVEPHDFPIAVDAAEPEDPGPVVGEGGAPVDADREPEH